MFEAKLLVNGADAPAESGATFELISPVTGQVVTRGAAASTADATHAANVAAAAFPDWSASSAEQRQACLNRAAELIEERAAAFHESMVAETGATDEWCRFNSRLAAATLRQAAAVTTRITDEIIPSSEPGTTAFALRQPAGVCLGIAPWNAPVILGVRAIATALACANTVLLKASELCPRTHRLIGEVMHDAGFPPGVVNVVSNAPADAHAVVEALISHPAVRRVNFTGSTRVGRKVAEMAARHLKRCLLELSGKAPLVVLDDADLDEAVRAAAYGAFMNEGQICMSTERIIVLEEVADLFVEKFAARARTLTAGDPRDTRHSLGILVGGESTRRINALLDDALAKGAALVAGGQARGIFMDATVLDHVTPAMHIYREECFGPVATVLRVGSDDEAVTVANDSDYGLSAAVFGGDVARALRIARSIESGICHINGATVADEPQAPFGGVKASGYGRFGGTAALDEFTELRWITIADRPGRYAI